MMFLTRTCFPFNSCQAYKLQISPGNCTLHIVRCFEGSKAGHYNQPRTWTAEKTAQLAQEVQEVVGHDDLNVLDAFLAEMYGEQPDLWSEDLTGQARLRCITNYLTRMRLTDETGRLEFSFKDALDAPMPTGFQPWFEFESEVAKTHQLIFGHWAALQGKTISPHIQNVDGGCVWGQQLIAYRLEDQQVFALDNPLA